MSDTPAAPRLFLPELEPGEEWWDVFLHFGGATGDSETELKDPPISDRFELSDNICIERLDAKVARQIEDACCPRNFNVPIQRQQAHTYAFVRKSRMPGLFNDTGGLEELAAVIAMSRLIHPTTMGIRYGARVAIVKGNVKQVLAYQPRGALSDAFCALAQNWLVSGEAKRLKKIMHWITTRELMPRRVHNAYWHHEYAVRTWYVDHRWSFVCTGLEALVHSSRNGSTSQFVHRVNLLAQREGVSFTEAELRKAYELRSGLVHGSQLLSEEAQLPKEDIDLYGRLETTLRKVLLRCFEDRIFAANFKDALAIDALMPMPPHPKRNKKASAAKAPPVI